MRPSTHVRAIEARAKAPSLGPGERIIDGRVHYSAAWLGASLEPPPSGRRLQRLSVLSRSY